MIFHRLIDETSLDFHRYLYPSFTLENRLVGLIGSRGTGKTTLLLQFIKQHFPDLKKVFYFSADHLYFNQTSIYSFVETLVLTEGIEVFFIDEIHKYKNWNQELKNLYDGFPSLKIVFSGSSSLDLIKGTYDLSRRAKMYHLAGLSFREYLNYELKTDFEPITMPNVLKGNISKEIINFPALLGHFHAYLKQGYYPFFKEDPLSYYEKLLTIIEKTIFEDISSFYNLKTENLRYFSKILLFLTSIPPGEVSTYNIGKNLGIDDKTAANYLLMLQDTGLVEIVYPAEPGNVGLRKPEKVFLSNTNLHYAISNSVENANTTGVIRELFFMQAIRNSGNPIFYCKKGDFQVNDYFFEVGGKNKNFSQIKGEEKAFLVKDDIISHTNRILPLYYFGFLY